MYNWNMKEIPIVMGPGMTLIQVYISTRLCRFNILKLQCLTPPPHTQDNNLLEQIDHYIIWISFSIIFTE